MAVGDAEGEEVTGLSVGLRLGLDEGGLIGFDDGCSVGRLLGDIDGCDVGAMTWW